MVSVPSAILSVLRNGGLWECARGITSQLWLPLQHVPILTLLVTKPLCPVASVAITTSVVVFESLASSRLVSLKSEIGTSMSLAAPPKIAVKSTFSNLKLPLLSDVVEKSAPVLHKDFEATLNLHFASSWGSAIFWTSLANPLNSKVALKLLKGVLSTNK